MPTLCRENLKTIPTPLREDIETKLTPYNGQAISYDASGNPTSYKGDTVTWNGRLMTSYTNSERHFEYAYNSDGMRTLKKVYENGELVYTEIYVWDGDVLLANKIIFTDGKDPVTARYLYDESGELYGMDYNGMGIFAYLKNLQGDIVSIISLGEDDSTEVQMEYDAWGKPIFKQGSNALGLVLIALVNSVSYRGYFYDYDTGLYYLRSRYYDPETGRFINADDVEMMIPQKPSQMTVFTYKYSNLNVFSYCQNNPMRDIDDSGKVSRSNSSNLVTKAFTFILFSAIIWDDKFIIITNDSYPGIGRIKGKITVSFIASFEHENIYKTIDALVKQYKDEVYDVITEIALGKFEERYSYPDLKNNGSLVVPNRKFLLSEKCVSNEIKKHFEGYMWSIGKKGYHCPLMFKVYSAIKKCDIRTACKEADMCEMDAGNGSAEALGFDYYNGIASIYKFTNKDPYYYPKEKKRKRKPNPDWLYYAF